MGVDGGAVDRLAGEGAVQIDQVNPFAAGLGELARLGRAELAQDEVFGPLRLRRVAG